MADRAYDVAVERWVLQRATVRVHEPDREAALSAALGSACAGTGIEWVTDEGMTTGHAAGPARVVKDG